MHVYKLINLSTIERKPAPNSIKKKTWEYYNYKIKEYLA